MDLVWRAHLDGGPHGFTTRIPQIVRPLPPYDFNNKKSIPRTRLTRRLLIESKRAVVVEFIGGGSGSRTVWTF